jgi:thymidylate synthase
VKFEPLYYGDRLRVVNPEGDVGVATLWSRVDQVHAVLEGLGIDLSAGSSRIAAMANLYGNGLPQMLRNLLYNPQIRYVLAVGQDLSGSRRELENFFAPGLEEVEYLGAPAHRIRGTTRIIDSGVLPADFGGRLRVTGLGKIGDASTGEALRAYFAGLPAPEACDVERRDVPIPEVTVERFPSEPRSHSILRRTPLEAWEELIFRLVRFGYRVPLAKGDRIELQNVRVVISEPSEEDPEDLARYGFSLDHFRDYQRRMLDAARPADLAYTYGNRLRGYFRHQGEPVDSLSIAIERLRADPETRHAYAALWDNARDLPEGHSCPCFVGAFFRRFEGRLTLTATFRTHNAMSAWLENVYGLMAVQRYVAEGAGMAPGPITVISHSISVSGEPGVVAQAQKVAAAKQTDDQVDRRTGKREPRFDPHGNFAVTVDRDAGEIVVQHSFDGMRIGEYRGKSAEAVEAQIARDVAISEISHALYLGREIARKEMELKRAVRPDGVL